MNGYGDIRLLLRINPAILGYIK